MDNEKLSSLVDRMASDFLFLNAREFDIPSAGGLLNVLEDITATADQIQLTPARRVGVAMNHLLEQFIMDKVGDRAAGFELLEGGISLLQEIVHDCLQKAGYEDDGRIDGYLASIGGLTGFRPAETQDATEKAEGAKEEQTPTTTAVSLQEQDEGLLRDFITESFEYIEQIEVNILNLEQNPEDKEFINAIFRPFHSIKGVASFLNLDNIRDISHSLENLLDKARNDELRVSPPIIDVILDGADALKSLIGQVRDVLDGKASAGEADDLTELLDRIHKLDRGVETTPAARLVGEILLEDGMITKDALNAGLKASAEKPGKKLGETLIAEGLATPKQVTRALRKQAEQITDTTTIRVDTRKLDDMIDMVGELVITQSMIEQDIGNQLTTDRNFMRNIAQLFRITSGLQRVTTSLRMIPIKQSFQRMSRLIRDLAKDSGKLIAVELVGEDTEIDRNMVDEIYTPLVHLVRNAVDHGLETPAERLAAGKTEKGRIVLKAYHRGGNIVIEIADDGRGLNREKILQKAIRNNLIHDGEGLSDQEIYRMILLPGLSTAERVTDVSGRGVGMDVVKQAVDKLRGKIDIFSSPGVGTTFTTSFPLTMAIIDGMIVKVGSQRYILPTTAIRQALRPARESFTNVVGRGETIDAMGRLLPLVRLGELFNIETRHKAPWEAIVVVVEGDGRTKGLMVDEILGKAEVVIKSLGEGIKNVRGIAGGAILGDGQIGLIIDPEGLFALSESSS
ncbi:MAG: chemotaxis protein CheA [Pseudomonadota bacterium]|nr:chemotaxis protein CheA [Pseudomonadota bacterium]